MPTGEGEYPCSDNSGGATNRYALQHITLETTEKSNNEDQFRLPQLEKMEETFDPI